MSNVGHSMTLKLCVFIIIEILCPVNKNGHNSQFSVEKCRSHVFFVAVKSNADRMSCMQTHLFSDDRRRRRYKIVIEMCLWHQKKPAPVVLIMIVKGFCACVHASMCVCMTVCKWKSICKAGVYPWAQDHSGTSRIEKEKCVRSWLLYSRLKWKSSIHLAATHA